MFSSSYIELTSKTWKSKHYLNIGKNITFGDKGEGYTDVTKWKHENITEKIKKKYSNSKYPKDFQCWIILLQVCTCQKHVRFFVYRSY